MEGSRGATSGGGAQTGDEHRSDTAQGFEDPEAQGSTAERSHVPSNALESTVEKTDPPLEELMIDGHQEKQYVQGLSLAIIILGLCFAVLLVALDNTILVTAIPKITDQFRSLEDIGWYGSAYLLTTCSLQLFYGRLYTIFNIKLVFLTAITIFELGSLICGVAQNSTTLIVGRAVAGTGAAGILSGAMIIIAHNVPLQKRPIYTGFTLGMYGIASVVGPLLGGVFTDNATWRWCAVVLVLLGVFLSVPPQGQQAPKGLRTIIMKLDPIGTLLFIPSIVCILLALQLGGSTYPWSNGRIIALFVMFAVLLLSFIGVQIWQGENATVPPRVFATRSIYAGSFYGFFLGGSFFIFIYYLPTWFQAIQSTSATQSGVRLLPISFSQMLGVIVSGALTTQFGHYVPFMYLGTVFMSIGAGFLTTIKPDSGAASWIGFQVIYGLGSGFGFQQPTLAAQAALAIEDVPTGVATAIFTQLLGGSLFVSVGQNLFQNRLISDATRLLPEIDPQTLARTGATELKNLVSGARLDVLLNIYNEALRQAFLVGTILAALTLIGAIVIPWKSIKGKELSVAV